LSDQRRRENEIRNFAGWLTSGEAEELKESMEEFNQVSQGDWP